MPEARRALVLPAHGPASPAGRQVVLDLVAAVLDRADAGYPAPITAGNWPGLQALYAGAAFELAPAGGSGAMQRYRLDGAVPADAQWAEVEIRFEHGNVQGDGFADNLSLSVQR